MGYFRTATLDRQVGSMRRFSRMSDGLLSIIFLSVINQWSAVLKDNK
jgi:hypothetical protein